jgi:formylglycine-generating enzyme required for sulfatase activity
MTDGVLPNYLGQEYGRNNVYRPRRIPNYNDGWQDMAPVQKSGRNEWGLYGVGGNVQEWCEGWYFEPEEFRPMRIIKDQGCHEFYPDRIRISARTYLQVGGWIIREGADGHNDLGFRVVAGPAVDYDGNYVIKAKAQ